ncbi:MAG TPA: penicillin acylase family protein [Puia sp.]|jgi:penicillin amidase|nr:penicillin acylase family protein [Puia sp.]
MKVVPFFICLFVTVSLIIALNRQWGSIPPIGKFVSPQHGFWQNADAYDKDYSADLKFPGIIDSATVYIDERLVPHIFAVNERDAYFIQGYLHAKFRLWQMEFEVYAAAGRISELIGDKALNFDREKRRLGMVYAAENSLKEMEADPITKSECDAYTEGVNTYIDNLKESELPVEYKLLNYKPEHWNNLKSALFLKYMSLDLAGHENDFEYTNAKNYFGISDFEKMYPYLQDSLDPIIPKGTTYPNPGVVVKTPANADSLYFSKNDSADVLESKPNKDNGSNNWAVSGKKTKSGRPILCNDPHLGLNLPSLWFEMQIRTPQFNAYGASFPCAPGIIIGFNDSCAFGFTNAERDVRDYYDIQFKDESMKEYWFNGKWKESTFRYDTIKIKGKPDFIDTVTYTVFGPVMYDKKFTGERTSGKKYYAVRWKAHDASNDLKTFNRLNHAKNYNDYFDAIKNLHTPGQNCIFACKNGDIAIWDQGEFPAKWKRQGDFIMPGTDSSYEWQGTIPQEENPHMINPEREFVSSANQFPVDPSVYPYYLGGYFPMYRGLTINRRLAAMNNITTDSMEILQTNNYNSFAAMAVPLLLKNISRDSLDYNEKDYYDTLKKWNYTNDVNESGATVFVLTWNNFEDIVWNDELSKCKEPTTKPESESLLESILKDSAYKFLDDINTPQKETLRDDILAAFRKTTLTLKNLEVAKKLSWEMYKDTRINHLAKLAPFSKLHLNIGGGSNCINAANSDHGPSWRMIVELTDTTNAYGIYPGGQSGNPGSRYYDNFVDDWAAGKYFKLWVMNKNDINDFRVKYKITFGK